MKKLPRLVVAAASSGSGKTTFTCALLHYLKQCGIRASAFKCGPDYIDPMFHRTVSDVSCVNIDSFFLREDADEAKKLISDYSDNSDIAVIEGVMGIFDGRTESTDYSTYKIARMTESPVVVLVDAKGSSLTALAVAEGIADFEKIGHSDSAEKSDLKNIGVVKGIIFNNMNDNVYSQVLDEYNRRRQTSAMFADFEIIGHIRKLPDELKLESRHLGLITPENVQGVREKIAATYEHMKDTIDWEKLMEIAALAKTPVSETKNSATSLCVGKEQQHIQKSDMRPVIAIAYDDAFNFYYEENIQALKNAGAEIKIFSPLADEAIPENAAGLYIGGGYPESHLDKLAKNMNTLASIRQAAASHMPMIAECGGFMYLARSIDAKDMCGIIEADCKYSGALVRFGYVTLTAAHDNVIMRAGDTVRAHEFHYYDTQGGAGSDCTARNLRGKEYGCVVANDWMFAGFPHIYFKSCEGLSERFVMKCQDYLRG